MIWKQFFFISGGICTAGILTCFVLILIFDCEALCKLFVCERCYINTFYLLTCNSTLQFCCTCELGCSWRYASCVMFGLFLCRPLQENEILTEQEELISLEQVLRPADRHRERRNWASACGDRRYTEVRGDTLVKLSNLRNIIMNYHNHVFLWEAKFLNSLFSSPRHGHMIFQKSF